MVSVATSMNSTAADAAPVPACAPPPGAAPGSSMSRVLAGIRPASDCRSAAAATLARASSARPNSTNASSITGS
eukprot:204903-Chlamydomonas_euryale.AAC.1